MIEEDMEIVGGVEIATDIKKRIETKGIRSLSVEKAQELGVFQRIANLICVVHTSIMAAFHVYGRIETIIGELQARRNEIAREMNLFEKAYERFVRFWTGYYADKSSADDVEQQTENLYHKIMDWMQVPEEWQLGGAQRTEHNKELAIKIEQGENFYTFCKSCVDQETLDSHETWGVVRYDIENGTQKCIHPDMDKASALMVAKRLSEDNPEYFYFASIIREVTEKRTEVTPYKAFHVNKTIGKVTNMTRKG